MRKFLIGVGLVAALGGGVVVAQEQTTDSSDTGGAAGNCATPFASPDLMASPEIMIASPEASPASIDCGTPEATPGA